MDKISSVKDSGDEVPAIVVVKDQEGQRGKHTVEEEHYVGNLEYMRGTVYQRVVRSK